MSRQRLVIACLMDSFFFMSGFVSAALRKSQILFPRDAVNRDGNNQPNEKHWDSDDDEAERHQQGEAQSRTRLR